MESRVSLKGGRMGGEECGRGEEGHRTEKGMVQKSWRSDKSGDREKYMINDSHLKPLYT